MADDRPTSFAKSLEGLHYETGPLDRAAPAKPEFNGPAKQPEITYVTDKPRDGGIDFAATNRNLEAYMRNHADRFKGIDIGAPPKGILRGVFHEPEQKSVRRQEPARETDGSAMVRADAPGMNFTPRGMTRQLPDRQAYYKRLAHERAAANLKSIRARDGQGVGRDRERERGR
jgi:hypothetical protein